MFKRINTKQWKEALFSCANHLGNNTERINALNVFPVPDGDTGSNMYATVENAYRDIDKNTYASISDLASAFSKATLMSARGNSGVILSQFFKGFAVAFKDKTEINTFDLVEAFNQGEIYAYKAVMKPVEGTILTVIRTTAKALATQVTPAHSIIDFFELAYARSREACDKTPEQLSILKEVGVVDSGGEGLVVIIEGMLRAIKGQPVSLKNSKENFANSFIMENEVWGSDEYGYCTEFIVRLSEPGEFDQKKFERNLRRKGNSIVIVQDEDILKVHIHTLRPGRVFNSAQRLGEFVKLKSENMTLQANESNAQKQTTSMRVSKKGSVAKSSPAAATTRPSKTGNSKHEVMIVSCNTGAGIQAEMKALGANFILNAGQTMNPSALDLMRALDSLPSDQIILLPNNPNILLVAQQVAQTTKKSVAIVPTKTQMQGLVSMLVFDPEDSLDNNQKAMEKAMHSVVTGQVTSASRDTKMDGVSIKRGDFLGIVEKNIVISSNSLERVARKVIDKGVNKKVELVTIYYGEQASEKEAVNLANYITDKYDAEVEIKNGGQPLYHFFISFAKELEWK